LYHRIVAGFYALSLFLLRVVTGFTVWQHGAQKLFGMLGGVEAAAFTPAAIGGAAEFFGGVALAAGFLTRPVAVILAVDMATIYVTQYLPAAFPPILIRPAEVTCLLLCTTSLLVFTGPGGASVDALLTRAGARERLAGLETHAPVALDVLRVLMGLMFFSYGLRKMFGLLEGEPEPVLSLQWYAGIIELFGGAALIVGLFTRPVAFLCSGEMAFAYFINHHPRGFFPIQNGGERAALFCFFFLFLWAAGPGKWSLDHLLRSSTRRRQLETAAITGN
jgi:putative oxidoreductase